MEDVLRFAAFSSSIDPGLWHALAKRKLDSDRLGVSWTRLTAGYSSCGRRSQTTQQQLPLLFLDAGSFGESTGPLMSSSGGLHVQGSLLNTNTLEDFKALDKSAILSDLTAEVHTVTNVCIFMRYSYDSTTDLERYRVWSRSRESR